MNLLLVVVTFVVEHALCRGQSNSRRYSKEVPFRNATHYWPLDYYDGKGLLEDKRSNSRSQLHNGIKLVDTSQLDQVLELDGIDDWIDIKNLHDSCISELVCSKGLSVGFWLSFMGGDYVLAAGGYAGSAMGPPGFRLQKDWRTKVYKLEVATRDRVWELFISKIPQYWVYFSFSWSPDKGLYVYFNGELKLKDDQAKILSRSKRFKGDVSRSMVIGKADRLRRLQYYGKFKIGHLAIWKTALNEKDMRKAFQAVIRVTPQTQICCYYLQEEDLIKDPCLRLKYPERWERLKTDQLSRCICPELKLGRCNDDKAFMEVALVESTKVNEENPVKAGAVKDMSGAARCRDRLSACKKFAQQDGYCQMARQQLDFTCPASCHFCVGRPKIITTTVASPAVTSQATDANLKTNGKTVSSQEPNNIEQDKCTCQDPMVSSSSSVPRFSQETLIFALCGCIGGIIVLLGITLYFWRAYRTRYTGAFVPPIKTVSLLDVNDYDDRWPKKYIDSAAFQITDVPPKKRALPIIPARTTQSAKYQPPEFD